MSVPGRRREREAHVPCLPSLPWVITALHWTGNGPFLAFQAMPAQSCWLELRVGLGCGFGIASSHLESYSSATWLQVPSNPSAKFPGLADNFVKGWIYMGLP